jgi:pilus assembly protein Flp/PilA
MLGCIRKAVRHAKDEGASAVEYALMVAAIAAVIVGVVFGLGRIVQNAFDRTCASIAAGVAPNATGNCPPASSGG